MPIPDILKLVKHLPIEPSSRTCPVCSKLMTHMTDGFKYLDKCLSCGYSHMPTGDINDQRRFDYNFTIVQAALQKAGYYELHQPIEEQLYNKLMTAERTPEEAINEVISDLQLSENDADYFKEKLNFLGQTTSDTGA